MNISKKMQDALNAQIAFEFQSAYIYLGMSAYCSAQNYPGCARWLRLQWQEETGHATRLMDYLVRRGGQGSLSAIEKPTAKFTSLLSLFEQVLKHEQQVTAKIHKLYDLAAAEKDHATTVELQWFVNEQVEEEENATEIVETLRRVGDHAPALMMLDRRLGERQG